MLFVECIARAIDAPEFTSFVAIKVPERLHGKFGSVGKRGESASRSHRAGVVTGDRSMRNVPVRTIASGEAPRISRVSSVLLGIFDAVGVVNERQVAVVLNVVGEAIVDPAGIKSHIGIMGEKERRTFCADVQTNAEEGPAADKFVCVRDFARRFTVGPAGVIQFRRNRMSR